VELPNSLAIAVISPIEPAKGLATAEGFEIFGIKEEYEDPVTLFLVSTRKA
jgi:hypothetical protein